MRTGGSSFVAWWVSRFSKISELSGQGRRCDGAVCAMHKIAWTSGNGGLHVHQGSAYQSLHPGVGLCQPRGGLFMIDMKSS